MRMFSLLTLVLSLFACHKPSPSNELMIGTLSGPETALVQTAQKVAKDRYGLEVKIIEFSDYNLPNAALQDGSLDANIYQHLPYLEAASKAHGYDFEVIGRTFVYPTGMYSQRYHTLKDFPDHATIALPNDPSNESRALLLLQQGGLIRLKNTLTASLQDIEQNPHMFRFKELDAAQLPRVLTDVDAAIINTNFAIPANLKLSDALLTENKDSPYANLIVIRNNSDKKQALLLFVKAMNSQPVKEKAQNLFGDAAIAAW